MTVCCCKYWVSESPMWCILPQYMIPIHWGWIVADADCKNKIAYHFNVCDDVVGVKRNFVVCRGLVVVQGDGWHTLVRVVKRVFLKMFETQWINTVFNQNLAMVNRIWPIAVAGEADTDLALSVSACHIGGPNSVNPGQILLVYSMRFLLIW